jgi:hypothetical protein
MLPDKTAECIRKANNIAYVDKTNLSDTKGFDAEIFDKQIEITSPKLKFLLDNIQKLDQADVSSSGKMFKHMIFTDISSSLHGYKVLMSGLVARGFVPCFSTSPLSGFTMHGDNILMKTSGNNIGLLISKPYGGITQSESFKQKILKNINSRPINVHGDLIRILVLDEGFKEGIDLFDLKYIHLFEPLLPSSKKQAIGRGTRFCGQSGLKFDPVHGWPLHVYQYDTNIAHGIHADKTGQDMWLKYLNLDSSQMKFAADLEDATINAAVDKALTKNIHAFNIQHNGMSGGNDTKNQIIPINAVESNNNVQGMVMSSRSYDHVPPTRVLSSLDLMDKHIHTHFGDLAYAKVELKNMCNSSSSPKNDTSIVEFTNTQDFVRHYFTTMSPYKGMLLWHSVGTGKTCTAIAAATSSFDQENYTILWVTRHTLKAGIWKNMVEQVCNIIIREKIENGTLKLPKNIKNPSAYVSKNWMHPISFKQFSNMLQKKNVYYDDIVSRNGNADPLKRTLIIIDEVHKLYDTSVSKKEQPDVSILQKWIQNSYTMSGKDSVRLLCMTATPFSNDCMELIHILNMLRPTSSALPSSYAEFSSKYLLKTGKFTQEGRTAYMDDISGYVSYLDRSKDGRMFAQQVFHNVVVPFHEPIDTTKSKESENKLKSLKRQLKDAKSAAKDQIKHITVEIKESVKHCKEKNKTSKEASKETKRTSDAKCMEIKTMKERKDCKHNAKEVFDNQNVEENCQAIMTKLDDEVAKVKEKYNITDIEKELEKLNDKVVGLNREINTNRHDIKALMTTWKEKRASYQSAYNNYKIKVKAAKELPEDQRNAAIQYIRATLLRPVKVLKYEMVELKVRINKLRMRMKTAQVGLKRKEDFLISQFQAFEKCIHNKEDKQKEKEDKERKERKEKEDKERKEKDKEEKEDKERKERKEKEDKERNDEKKAHAKKDDDVPRPQGSSKGIKRNPDMDNKFIEVYNFYDAKFDDMIAKKTINDKRALLITFHPDKVPKNIKDMMKYEKVSLTVNAMFDFIVQAQASNRMPNKVHLMARLDDIIHDSQRGGKSKYV